MHTSDGFNPNVYKLMKKYGYNFNKPPSLGQINEAKPMGLMTRKKWYKDKVVGSWHCNSPV